MGCGERCVWQQSTLQKPINLNKLNAINVSARLSMGLSNGFSQLLHHEAGFFLMFSAIISSILEKLFAFNTQKECRKSAGLIKT